MLDPVIPGTPMFISCKTLFPSIPVIRGSDCIVSRCVFKLEDGWRALERLILDFPTNLFNGFLSCFRYEEHGEDEEEYTNSSIEEERVGL